MELSQQVTSLELSKRLKELGVKQESLFYWIEDYELYSSKPELLYAPTSQVINGNGELDYPRNNEENCYSAFTVAELGNLLPICIWIRKSVYLHCEPANRIGYWVVRYGNELFEEELTEADARAKMLIYLLENKLIKEDLIK